MSVQLANNQQQSIPKKNIPQRNTLAKILLFTKKTGHGVSVISEGFYLIFRHQLYKHPNHPENTRYVQYFCRRLGEVFNVKVQVHGEIPRHTALWVSNHISWLDIAVVGAGARIFFLAKAEVASWPILGKLAAWGGTLFIKRGSGDAILIREQITVFLRQNIPVLFFPEATTTDGKNIKRVHGKLLGAAIDAQKPVQICLISYVNAQGLLDTVVPFIGKQSMIENLTHVLQMDEVIAHLIALPAIDTTGHSIESLTPIVHQQMVEGLAKLHQEVLAIES